MGNNGPGLCPALLILSHWKDSLLLGWGYFAFVTLSRCTFRKKIANRKIEVYRFLQCVLRPCWIIKLLIERLCFQNSWWNLIWWVVLVRLHLISQNQWPRITSRNIFFCFIVFYSRKPILINVDFYIILIIVLILILNKYFF